MSGNFTFAVIIGLRRSSKHAKFPACVARRRREMKSSHGTVSKY